MTAEEMRERLDNANRLISEYAEWDGKCRYQKEPGKWEVYHNEKRCKHKSL